MSVPISNLVRMEPNAITLLEVTSARVLVAGSMENTATKVRISETKKNTKSIVNWSFPMNADSDQEWLRRPGYVERYESVCA